MRSPQHHAWRTMSPHASAGPQRSWLLRQMELDTTFLRELNVLDYSLLMAFQRLQEDERGPGSLLFRTAR